MRNWQESLLMSPGRRRPIAPTGSKGMGGASAAARVKGRCPMNILELHRDHSNPKASDLRQLAVPKCTAQKPLRVQGCLPLQYRSAASRWEEGWAFCLKVGHSRVKIALPWQHSGWRDLRLIPVKMLLPYSPWASFHSPPAGYQLDCTFPVGRNHTIHFHSSWKLSGGSKNNVELNSIPAFSGRLSKDGLTLALKRDSRSQYMERWGRENFRFHLCHFVYECFYNTMPMCIGLTLPMLLRCKGKNGFGGIQSEKLVTTAYGRRGISSISLSQGRCF